MNQPQALIEVQDIVYRWAAGRPPVLDIAALSVLPGERVFVKGPSGSGKSTLLSLLGGVLVPQAGRVQVLGSDLSRLGGARRDAFRADHIGFIFQMFNLIPYLSVLENVCLPLQFSTLRRDRVHERGGMRQEALRLLSHLDLATDEVLARPVTELSVGQQQRVAAARALLGAPRILIADEPTSALDADRRAAFISLLIRECAAESITLVFVSHDSALQGFFDRTIDLAAINRAGAAAREAGAA
jgi:putative ABC transport system ATP-binding protein